MGAAPEHIVGCEDIIQGQEEHLPRRPRVIVTGFGPFGNHSINASWAAVRRLPNFSDLLSVCDLHLYEVPVVYEVVQREVPKLWQQIEPDLVIHVGVSGILAGSGCLELETCAWNHGYLQCDVNGCTPHEECCPDASCPDQYTNYNLLSCASTSLPVELVCRELNNSQRDPNAPQFRASVDAGRYLCEFIFRTSLNIGADRTLFMHVPPLSTPFSADDIAIGIKEVILSCLSHLRSFQREQQQTNTITERSFYSRTIATIDSDMINVPEMSSTPPEPSFDLDEKLRVLN